MFHTLIAQIGLCCGFFLLAALLGATQLYAEDTEEEITLLNLFEEIDAPLPGRLLKPLDYDPEQTYPLVVFLHGAGERGDDNERQLIHVVARFAEAKARATYPAFVLAMQCPEGQQWVNNDWSARTHQQDPMPSEPMAGLLKTIAALDRDFSIDHERIYAIGLSMGGYGTFDLVTRYPKLFAAVVPICGGGDVEMAERLKDMPLWVFHGDDDAVVPVARSRNMVQAIEEAGGAPRYTEYNGVGHDAWTPASQEPELLSWLFAQRNDSPEMPLTAYIVSAGERILYFGDSITQAGVAPGGYVSLVREALEAGPLGSEVTVIGAGISGNRVPDLLARLDADVLAENPSLVVVYIGINDVWHWDSDRGTTEDDFRSGLHTLIQRIRDHGAGVMLCTPTVIGEKPLGENPHDAMLETYAAISREVARAEGVDLLDLRKYFMAWLSEENTAGEATGILTTDGVHLNAQGNQLLAQLMRQAITGMPLPAFTDLPRLLPYLE